MKKTILIVLLIACSLSRAEMRTWRNKSGDCIQGDFQKEIFGDAVLKTPDHKTVMIPIADLSVADQNYVYTKVPPEVEIGLSKTSRLKPAMEWTIPDDVTTLYTFNLLLTKKSDIPYRGTLIVELFLVGDEVDGENFVLVHYQKDEFTFSDERNSTYTMSVTDVPFRRYWASWARQAARFRGTTYNGYIVTVSDKKGHLIASDTDVTEEWLKEDFSATIDGLRILAENGRGSAFSRHFDENIQKSEVPRIPWHKRTDVF